MEETDGLRFKPFDDSASLAPSTAESINLEDARYAKLREDLEDDAQYLEADSWSVAVDQNYLKALDKQAVKRQDVIYELMQTEMHHVRTLKILYYVYMYELKETLQMDQDRLERLFPVVEHLLKLHLRFLSCLKQRRKEAQEQDTVNSANNYQITQLADILISQFSGDFGENMKECYGIFCCHNSDASSLYKEQLQNNKKFQNLIRRIGQSPIVKRQSIPDCFLLVTQRITKYPVLVERILQNTEADTEEHESLVTALAAIRDTISQVDTCVNDYKNAVRLNVISRSLEPKSLGRLKGGRLFRREDLVQGARTLLHEGTIVWKAASGKNKDIHAVLLTDVLLLLQEKDQKFVFAALDNKPSVISLQRLIVREVAHEDRAMFLICASSQLPEMYEIHTGSKADRDTWMSLIRDAVDSCPEGEEELYSEQEARAAKLQEFHDQLTTRDTQIVQSLTEKLQLFATYGKAIIGLETSHKRLLLRGDASDLQQGETLLKGAITEVENLQTSLMSEMRDCHPPSQEDQAHGSHLRRAQTFAGFDSSPSPSQSHHENVAERPGSAEGSPLENNNHFDSQLQEIDFSESQELSADDETPMPCWNSTFNSLHEEELFDKVVLLSQRLYSLQAIIAQQDSQLELQRAALSEREARPARHRGSMLLEQEKQRNLEKQREETANFQKLQAQHQQERRLWEKERERHRVQAEVREEECRRLEKRLLEERAELEGHREAYQQDLATLREATQKVQREKGEIEEQQKKIEEQQKKLKKQQAYQQPQGLTYYPSFRGDVRGGGAPMSSPSFRGDVRGGGAPMSSPSFRGDVRGGGAPMSSPKSHHIRIPTTADLGEVPPVPPRKESISPLPVKAEVPIHLVSTTNQSHKPGAVQQQIPTKLAALSKGKDKDKSFRTKGSHQRTHSAASIDMSQVIPIRVTGKEGGSLRAKRNSSSPQRIHHSVDRFTPPGPVGVKVSQSFSVHKRSSEMLPPEPPPFPKDVIPFPKDVIRRDKDGVIFF